MMLRCRPLDFSLNTVGLYDFLYELNKYVELSEILDRNNMAYILGIPIANQMSSFTNFACTAPTGCICFAWVQRLLSLMKEWSNDALC